MVAIIGAGCVLPGGIETLDEFWDALIDGQNMVCPIPADRWNLDRFYHPEPTASGKTTMHKGHFIKRDFTQFDHDVFRLSKREAEGLDPQQRLLLETVWRSFEYAGYALDSLPSRDVGVYCGGFMLDHFLSQYASENRSRIGAYTASGSTMTMLSNRISHCFDFHGPSMTIDTACSSSLVAFDRAVADLRDGRCEFAVVGGANIMFRPESPIAMSKGGFLAKDGKSKSFMAEGDGYGRGEGVVALILRREDDALEDGNEILATCVTSGVNQDGRTPGITLPDGEAQKRLISSVVERAKIAPEKIQYVEAHGTGTAAGDPVEIDSIASVYGQRPAGDLCYVGSAKSNFGHLEAASGLVSVLKAAMVLKKGKIPPIAEFTTANPSLKFDPKRIALATKTIPLAEGRMVAVNSFGYGGTNAHVILQQHKKASDKCVRNSIDSVVGNAEEISKEGHYFIITAANKKSLVHRVRSIRDLVEQKNYSLPILEQQLRGNLDLLRERLVIRASTAKELCHLLDDAVQNNCQQAQSNDVARNKVGFIFTGMGPQWWGMGQTLWEKNVVYRNAVEAVDRIYQENFGFSILKEMLKPEATSQIHKTEYAQPANFVIQVGLFAILKAEGIHPFAVSGHSVGEVMSGYVSGALTLEEAVLVSVKRSCLQADLAGTGKMMAVALSQEEVKDYLTDLNQERVSIAAVNAPRSITLSGDEEVLVQLAKKLEAADIFHRMLDVEVPYHSPVMERIEQDIKRELASIKNPAYVVPLVSTVTGAPYNGKFDGEYWYQNVRQTVNFKDAVEALVELGCDYLLEVGPHPVLSRSIKECLKGDADNLSAVVHGATLHQQKDELAQIQACIQDIFVKTNAFDRVHHKAVLPKQLHYFWDHRTLWLESLRSRNDRLSPMVAPMLERQIGEGEGYQTDLALYSLDYLKAHVVDGLSVLPGASLIEAALEGWKHQDKTNTLELSSIRFLATQLLDNDGSSLLTKFVRRKPNQVDAITELWGLESDTNRETLLCDMHVRSSSVTLKPWDKPDCTEHYECDSLYQSFQDIGLHSHSFFQPIETLSVSDDGAHLIGVVTLASELSAEGFVLHPTVLDGVFQLTASFISDPTSAYVPISVDRMIVNMEDACEYELRSVEAIGKLVNVGPVYVTADIQIRSVKTKQVLMEISGFTVKRIKELMPEQLTPTGNFLLQWPEKTRTDVQYDPQKALVLVPEKHPMQMKFPCATKTFDLINGKMLFKDIPISVGYSDQLVACFLNDTALSHVGFVVPIEGISAQEACEAATVLKTALEQANAQGAHIKSLTFITQNAVDIHGDFMMPVNIAHAALMGTRGVLWSETEELQIKLLDLDCASQNIEAAWLPDLLGTFEHDEVAFRNGQRYVSVVQKSPVEWPEMTMPLTHDEAYRWIKNGRTYVRESLPKKASYEGLVKVDFSAYGLDYGLMKDQKRYALVVGRQVKDGVEKTVVGLALAQAETHWDVDTANFVDVGSDASIDDVLNMTITACAKTLLSSYKLNPGDRLLVSADPIAQRAAIIAQKDGVLVDVLDAKMPLQATRKYNLMLVRVMDHGMERLSSFLSQNGNMVSMDHVLDHVPHSPFVPHVMEVLCQEVETFLTLTQQQQGLPPLLHKNDSLQSFSIAQYNGVMLDDFMQSPVCDWRFSMKDQVTAVQAMPFVEDRDHWLLVTGGFGGIGRKFLPYLAAQGVKKILVTGRSQDAVRRNKGIVQRVQDMGTEIVYLSTDLSKLSSVENLRDFQNHHGPIGHILHMAGVVADAPATLLTQAQFQKVFEAKLKSFEHVLESVDQTKLKSVIGFSSITLITGNSRQANYCGANGALEAMLHNLCPTVHHCLSINVGAIRDAGMIARDLTLRKHIDNSGLGLTSTAHLFAGMQRALLAEEHVVTVAPEPEWNKWKAFEPLAARSMRFVDVLHDIKDENMSVRSRLFAQIWALDKDKQSVTLAEVMREMVAPIMKITPTDLDVSMQFRDLGVDSLMAAEIQNSVREGIGLDLSILSIIAERASLSSLADFELKKAGDM